MRSQWQYLAAGAAVIVVLLLTWFVAPLLHLSGVNALVLRAGILLLGVIAIIGLILWARSNAPSLPAADASQPQPASGASGGAASQDVDILVREASGKVAAARLGAGAKLTSLPAVFLLGESGAGKTSAMDQSGLDAELLAGQVYQEASIVPTRVANLWFARKTVFVEAGGPLMDDPASWIRLVKHFLPGSVSSVFGGGSKAPRAAVVCIDSEKLVRESSLDKVVAQARKLRARLEELSSHLGISLPVYVVFNRADRIPYFEEFAATFSNEETTQVLGSTLPLAASAAGVYAEQETKRLAAAFQGMFFALAECRPGLLGRERSGDRQAGIYEFPREFSKLSKPLVQFLVDLCRPGHLRTGPFLRGFYFAGQRIITVSPGSQTTIGPRSAARAPGGFSADATSLISAQDAGTKASWQTGTSLEGAGESRKSLQRVFLSHVFSHVILQDRAALGASGKSVRGDVGRRILFATLAFFAFLWMIFTTVSFVGNYQLQSAVRTASQDLSSVQNLGTQPPSLDSLRRLDSLRQTLVQLRDYQNGAPFHLRWGLYTGDVLLDDARAIYFRAFDKVLFQHTKQNLMADLRTYRGVPQPNADSGLPYDSLKAYLLTTSESARNSNAGEFLQDFLMKDWRRDWSDLDQDHADLAAQQFAFYSSELSIDNPFPKTNDAVLIDQVRGYLNSFSGLQRLYTSMLNDARQKARPYRFALAHPDGLDTMHGGPDVDAAFTSDGYKVMDQSIQNPKRIQGEPWVLGPAGGALPSGDLSSQLRAMYESDFIKAWRAFLNGSSVLPYKDVPDVAKKLAKLSSNSSPLLALVCDTSENTNVASNAIKQAFLAPQQVVAPGCKQILHQPSNDAYMKGLFDLQDCAQGAADAPPDQTEAKKTACQPMIDAAKRSAGQIELGLPHDPDGRLDTQLKALLDAPTKLWPGPPQINNAGGLCEGPGSFNALKTAYPFKANATREITLEEFNAVFQPGQGKLSQYLNSQRTTLSLQGTTYVPALGDSVQRFGPNFLHTINTLYAIQLAVYPNGGKDPHFEYSVTAHLPTVGGWKTEKLNFDGQEWTISGAGGTRKFIWPNAIAQGATLSMNNGGSDIDMAHYEKLWAVSHFFSGYRWQSSSATGYIIQGPLIGPTGQPMTSNGQPIEVRFDVDFKGVQFFQAGYMSSFACGPMNK